MFEKLKNNKMLIVFILIGVCTGFMVAQNCGCVTTSDGGFKPDYRLLGQNAAFAYYAIQDEEPDLAKACEIAYGVLKKVEKVESYQDLMEQVSVSIVEQIDKPAQRMLAMMVVQNVISSIKPYLGDDPIPGDIKEALVEFVEGAESVVSTWK